MHPRTFNACMSRIASYSVVGGSHFARIFFCPGYSDHNHRHRNDHHGNDAWWHEVTPCRFATIMHLKMWM